MDMDKNTTGGRVNGIEWIVSGQERRRSDPKNAETVSGEKTNDSSEIVFATPESSYSNSGSVWEDTSQTIDLLEGEAKEQTLKKSLMKMAIPSPNSTCITPPGQRQSTVKITPIRPLIDGSYGYVVSSTPLNNLISKKKRTRCNEFSSTGNSSQQSTSGNLTPPKPVTNKAAHPVSITHPIRPVVKKRKLNLMTRRRPRTRSEGNPDN